MEVELRTADIWSLTRPVRYWNPNEVDGHSKAVISRSTIRVPLIIMVFVVIKTIMAIEKKWGVSGVWMCPDERAVQYVGIRVFRSPADVWISTTSPLSILRVHGETVGHTPSSSPPAALFCWWASRNPTQMNRFPVEIGAPPCRTFPL